MTGALLAQAAAGMQGCRWRLHGRDPASGLDCIGLLGAALAEIGRPVELPTGYRLHVSRLDAWLPDPARLGFVIATGAHRPGDVVLVQPAPAQVHLAIAGHDGGWIHAHAGLRTVVCQPALPAGPILARWRLSTFCKDPNPWQQ